MPDTQPAENAQVSLGLPPADQICLVVRDLQAAVALFEPLFGPFTVLDNGEDAGKVEHEERAWWRVRMPRQASACLHAQRSSGSIRQLHRPRVRCR